MRERTSARRPKQVADGVFVVRPMCVERCAIHVAGFVVMFACRRSVFEELQQRPPECVSDHDMRRVMARLRSSKPNACPPPCLPHVLPPPPRKVFPLRTLSSYNFAATRQTGPNDTTQTTFFSSSFFFFATCSRAQMFSLFSSFLVHVEHTVMTLQDWRPAVETRSDQDETC